MTANATAYNASSITVLEGLDPVRKRPGMYIGGTGSAGLHHLVWEIFDNSVDEAMNGHADCIEVTLHKDGASVTVSDNGRGIPVDNHPTHKKPAVEIILCTLHAGGTGTQIYFHPDPTIFPKTEFNPETIRERLEVASYIHKGLKVVWNDETSGKKETFKHEEGILAFLKKILAEKKAKPIHEQPFVLDKQNGVRMEMCFSWTESTE